MKGEKIKLIIFGIVFAALLVAFFRGKSDLGKNGNKMIVEAGGKKFFAEIASSEEERSRGLSGRDNLCPDCAMIFLFEKAGDFPFWMKEMKFDVDIIWIKGDKIVKIKKNASARLGEREFVDPQVLADKVLEINAGKSEELGIVEGDRIIF